MDKKMFWPGEIVRGNAWMLNHKNYGRLYKIVGPANKLPVNEPIFILYECDEDGIAIPKGDRGGYYWYKLDIVRPSFERSVMEAIEQPDAVSDPSEV